MISIVVPCYRCSRSLDELYQQLVSVLARLNTGYQIILVNDASPENDWEIIERLSKRDSRVIGIDLSRNFGQHYAITAGLERSTGEWIVVMDGDLQDMPSEIELLYNKALEGLDIVLARRVSRKDGFFKKLGSKLFYKLLAYLTETEQNEEVGNFGIYHRKVIDAILAMHDKIRYFPTMVKWVGFRRTEIDVTHAERTQGLSSYSFGKLLRLALSAILSFSDKPLRLTVKFGLLLSLTAFSFAIFLLIKSLSGKIEVLGYSSIIISIWFLAGILITLLGILGLYVGKIFDQVKNRPTFIVRQVTNMD